MTRLCYDEYLTALENEIISLSDGMTDCDRRIQKVDQLLSGNPGYYRLLEIRQELVSEKEKLDKALSIRQAMFGNIRGFQQNPVTRVEYTKTIDDRLVLGDIFYFYGKEAYELELAIREVAKAARLEDATT